METDINTKQVSTADQQANDMMGAKTEIEIQTNAGT